MTLLNFTVSQLAERLQVSDATIYVMIRRGELKSFKFGRQIRISGAEVQRIEATKATAVDADFPNPWV